MAAPKSVAFHDILQWPHCLFSAERVTNETPRARGLNICLPLVGGSRTATQFFSLIFECNKSLPLVPLFAKKKY